MDQERLAESIGTRLHIKAKDTSVLPSTMSSSQAKYMVGERKDGDGGDTDLGSDLG